MKSAKPDFGAGHCAISEVSVRKSRSLFRCATIHKEDIMGGSDYPFDNPA